MGLARQSSLLQQKQVTEAVGGVGCGRTGVGCGRGGATGVGWGCGGRTGVGCGWTGVGCGRTGVGCGRTGVGCGRGTGTGGPPPPEQRDTPVNQSVTHVPAQPGLLRQS
jgi:hypothetical protein